MLNHESHELQFEARFYLAEAQRLRKQAEVMLKQADEMRDHAVMTWSRVKEVSV